VKELVLVRHGEAEHLVKKIMGGWTDLPLTNRGRQQMELTAHRLKDLFGSRIEVIYASDLIRAKEAADIINNQFDVPLIVDSRFREMNYGLAKDMTHEEAEKIAIPQSEPQVDWISFPGGESWRMLRERLAGVLAELDQKDEEVVLIVSHGNAIATMIEWWMKIQDLQNMDFRNMPASLTWLGISYWGNPEMRKLNETAHLSDSGLDDCLIFENR
jgi:probable phosphoglycerate mutase